MDDDDIHDERARIRARLRAANAIQDRIQLDRSQDREFTSARSQDPEFTVARSRQFRRLTLFQQRERASREANSSCTETLASQSRHASMNTNPNTNTNTNTSTSAINLARSATISERPPMQLQQPARRFHARAGPPASSAHSEADHVSIPIAGSIVSQSADISRERRNEALQLKLLGDRAARSASDHVRADPGGTHSYDQAYGDALIFWLRATHRLGRLGDASEMSGRTALRELAHESERVSLRDINQGLHPLVLSRNDVRAAFRMVSRTFFEMSDAHRCDARTRLTSLEILGVAWPCIRRKASPQPTVLPAVPPAVPLAVPLAVPSAADAADAAFRGDESATTSPTVSTASETVEATAVAAAGSSIATTAQPSTLLTTAASASSSALSIATSILIASFIEMVAVPQLAGPCFEGRRNRIAQALSLALDDALAPELAEFARRQSQQRAARAAAEAEAEAATVAAQPLGLVDSISTTTTI